MAGRGGGGSGGAALVAEVHVRRRSVVRCRPRSISFAPPPPLSPAQCLRSPLLCPHTHRPTPTRLWFLGDGGGRGERVAVGGVVDGRGGAKKTFRFEPHCDYCTSEVGCCCLLLIQYCCCCCCCCYYYYY